MNTRSLDKMAFVYIALVQNNFVILRVEDIAIACAFSRHWHHLESGFFSGVGINHREKSRSQSSTFLHIWAKYGFYFFMGKLGNSIGPSNEIDRISKVDNSLSFGTKQTNILRQIFYDKYFTTSIFQVINLFLRKIQIEIFSIFYDLCRINKEVYWCLFEPANIRKHVPECSCSSFRVF